MKNTYPVIIIGNGAAALSALEALEACGATGPICLLTDDEMPMYNPTLTPYYISGKIERDACFLYGSDWSHYKRDNLEVHAGSAVVDLDCAQKRVRTADNMEYHYEKCLIASGAKPIRPEIPGIDREQVYCLRTMADADRLKTALMAKPRRALVVGASMVGFKAVEICLRYGIDVSLADICGQVLPMSAHPDSAAAVEAWLRDRGVHLHLNTTVCAIEDSGVESARVQLMREETKAHDFDLIIVAIGVKPNLDFVDRSELDVDRGLLVDQTMRTSDHCVYAAGDVAQAYNRLSGKRELIGLWSHAVYQGRTAGRNIAGRDDRFAGSVPGNVIHLEDMVFASVGDTLPQQGVETEMHQRDGGHTLLAYRDGKLVGANMFANVEQAGILRQEIIAAAGGDAPRYRDCLMYREGTWCPPCAD